jgi:polar amino acid transport system ATP-binding protein
MAFISIKSVYKSYGKLDVLKGVSLDIQKGEIVAVIGRSGSGKSTLLRCINALETTQRGEIWIEGQLVHPKIKNLKELRQRVGIVFQSFNLFPHLTVEQNITLAPRLTRKFPANDCPRLAVSVLSKVGLLDKLKFYPAQLSGGQQQRVAIARCLAMSPTLMLFDEVTSALDPELVAEVLKVIEDMAQEGMTMILVTHEMEFARRLATKIVFMHEGRVWEEGTPVEIFSAPRTQELKTFIKPFGQSEKK